MSEICGWKYYNHAMIPTSAPHIEKDTTAIQNGLVWKDKHKPLLARWTSDFDCGYDTGWWYCIKDEPFDIAELKSNYRYKINKGKKYFECKVIDPAQYIEELYQVQVAAFSAYPEMYRPKVDHDTFVKDIENWIDGVVYGAFERETGELGGYTYLMVYEDYANLSVQKTNPAYEKHQINAALISAVLEDFEEKLSKKYYIVDGERNIVHMTSFQEYLEKYFGFRKAYCKLHLKYRPFVTVCVRLLYPFRKILAKWDKSAMIHNVLGVLKMEEIQRMK